MGKNIIGGVPNWLTIVAVVGILWYGGFLKGIGAPAAIGGTTAPTGQPGVAYCSGGSTPSFDVLAYDLAQPGTNIATPAYTFYYNGKIVTATGGTALSTYDPGNQFQILASKSLSYYNVSKTGTFGTCKDNEDVKLPARVTFTRYSIYNPGTATNNTNNSAFGIATGETATVDIFLKCTADKQYCIDPNGGYLIVGTNLNTTEFDTSVSKTYFIDTEDVAVSVVSIPIADNGVAESAFKLTPKKEWKNFDTLHLKLALAAKSTVNPLGGNGILCNIPGNVGGTFAGLIFRESGFTKNSVSGAPIYGVENEVGTAIYPAQTEAICYS